MLGCGERLPGGVMGESTFDGEAGPPWAPLAISSSVKVATIWKICLMIVSYSTSSSHRCSTTTRMGEALRSSQDVGLTMTPPTVPANGKHIAWLLCTA